MKQCKKLTDVIVICLFSRETFLKVVQKLFAKPRNNHGFLFYTYKQGQSKSFKGKISFFYFLIGFCVDQLANDTDLFPFFLRRALRNFHVSVCEISQRTFLWWIFFYIIIIIVVIQLTIIIYLMYFLFKNVRENYSWHLIRLLRNLQRRLFEGRCRWKRFRFAATFNISVMNNPVWVIFVCNKRHFYLLLSGSKPSCLARQRYVTRGHLPWDFN